MSAVLRTFVCTPTTEIKRRSISNTSGGEFDSPGFVHLFNRGARPVYQFEFGIGPLRKAEAESISAFFAFHQHGKTFLWNGGPFARVDNYSLIGEGDTSRRDFFMPNRYITAGSFAFRTVNQATGATSNWAASSANGWPVSLSPTPGIVTTANSTNTIVGSGHDAAAVWACQYRCIFDMGEGFQIEEFTRGLYQATIKLQELAYTDAP